MSVHDLYVGATSVKGLSGILVPDWGGLYDIDVYRGEDKTFPGMPGQSGVEATRDAYVFQIAFNLKGADEAGLQTNIGALRALWSSSVLFTATRRLPQALTPFYVAKTCNAKYQGLVWTDTTHPLDIAGVLSIKNLDGEWT